MPTIFPSLLSYTLFAPLVLRAVIGLYFFLRGLKTWKKASAWHKYYSGFEIIIGIMFLLGIFVQVISILAIFDTTVRFGKVLKSGTNTEKALFSFILAVAISLLFSTSGFYSFDLPF